MHSHIAFSHLFWADVTFCTRHVHRCWLCLFAFFCNECTAFLRPSFAFCSWFCYWGFIFQQCGFLKEPMVKICMFYFILRNGGVRSVISGPERLCARRHTEFTGIFFCGAQGSHPSVRKGNGFVAFLPPLLVLVPDHSKESPPPPSVYGRPRAFLNGTHPHSFHA